MNFFTHPQTSRVQLLKFGYGLVISSYTWLGMWLFNHAEREIKFIGLFEDRGHLGPYSPYKLLNHNLYIGIIIFPHTDNPQSTGYN